jgi:hypothetical protein
MRVIKTRSARTTLAAGIATGALVLGGAVAALAVSAGTASASSLPDLSISQHIVGSSKSGHTSNVVTVRNIGRATASHVNVQSYISSTSGAFYNLVSGSGATCEVMPGIGSYGWAFACQFSSSIAAGHSASFTVDESGTAGKQFTSVATVGLYQADSNPKNNTSKVTSWLGPRADLAVSGTTQSSTKKKHATAVTTVLNRGPNAASSLDEEISVKGASGVLASGNVGNGCKIDSAKPTGYDFGVTCHLNSLASGKKWILTFDYIGTSGKKITMKTTVSAFSPADPVSANNTINRTVLAK